MKERELGLEKHPRLHFVEGQTEFSPCKRFLLRKERGRGVGELVVERAAVEDWRPAHWQQWTTRTITVGIRWPW
jgi:hypothetical protein